MAIEAIASRKKSPGLLIASGLLVLASLVALSVPFKGEQSIYYWFLSLGILITAIIVLSFNAVFNGYSWRVFTVFALLISAPVLALFPRHYLQIIGGLALFGSLLQMRKSITSSIGQRLHFSYYRAVKSGMSVFLTAVILLISLNIFISTREILHDNPQSFYDNTAAVIVKGARPLFQSQIKGFNADITLDEFILRSDLFESNNQFNGGEVILPNGNFEQLRENILDAFGVGASGDEQAVKVLQRVVSTRIRDLFAPLEIFVPLIYAVVLFLSLRFVMPILIWIAGGLGTLFFKLGLRLGWIKMRTQTATVEIPALKS